MKLEGVDPICVVIGRTRHKMIQAEMEEAGKNGVRLIELRLDFLAKPPDLKRLLENKPCPVVATIRRPQDGGRWSTSEETRRTLLRQCIVGGFDWVDLEHDVADAIPRFGKVRRIVSYHNLRETPADLEKIHEKMCQQDADVVKLAVRADKPEDNIRVLELNRTTKKPTVAFCMGDVGLPSRLLAGRFGAPFTYAAFNKERGVAPGILSFNEVKNLYRYPSITEQTRVFGLLGDPVSHSLSPLVHNYAYRKLGIDAVYLPFRVPSRGDLAAVLQTLDRIPVQGYSVTIPHKEAAAALAVHSDETVTETHAANTLLRLAPPREGFHAANTDYQGVIDALLAHLPSLTPDEPPTLESRTVLLLGAGGVARAVAHALHRKGALVTIVNRTSERAHKLAAEVGCRHQEWETRHTILCDLLVNCTSIGMHPNVDESPMHHSFFKEGMTVFDTVYTPETTLMIRQARDRGARIITGVELFARQAAVQFQLFTGEAAPADLFLKVARRALSPVAPRADREES